MKEFPLWYFEHDAGKNISAGSVCFPACENGICFKGECACFDGYFRDQTLNFSNCALSMEGTPFTILRSVIASIYFIFALISLGFFIVVIINRYRMYKIALYTKLWSFGTCIMAALVQCLHWGIDPSGYLGIISGELDTFLSVAPTPLLYSSYLGILFHWVAFVELAERSIQKANMWKKMGRTAEATVEDVIQKINISRRIRLPIMIFLIFFFIIEIAGSLLDFRYPQFHLLYIVYILQLLTTISIFICFLIFRYRVRKLLPADRKSFIQGESRVVFAVLLLNIVPWTLFGVSAAFVAQRRSYTSNIIFYCISSVIYFVNIALCLWIHARNLPSFRYTQASTGSRGDTSGGLELSSSGNYGLHKSEITLP